MKIKKNHVGLVSKSRCMNVKGTHYRTIWLGDDDKTVLCIDQRKLPHFFEVETLHSVQDVIVAIKEMHVRGAGLIGAAAGFGMYLAACEAAGKLSFDLFMSISARELKASRPTAVNLFMAVDRQIAAMAQGSTVPEKIAIAKHTAQAIADEDASFCQQIGEHGVKIIEEIHACKKGNVVNVLTHCNAGWLAFVDYGSALAPVYEAHRKGIPVHVWVDETRPRNQGASLTAWELLNQGIPHTVIADNTGGHLMQHGLVDMVITGADRVTASGDAANKIGTYLKALAAFDNHIPFYVALPSSTFDWSIDDGVKDIPIEERGADEVQYIQGLSDGTLVQVQVTPAGSTAANYGFDVTPARLITGLVTERGVCKPDKKSLATLFADVIQSS